LPKYNIRNPGGRKAGPHASAIVQGGGSGMAMYVHNREWWWGIGHGSAWCISSLPISAPGALACVTALQTLFKRKVFQCCHGNYGSQPSRVMNFQSQYAPQILAPSGLQTSTICRPVNANTAQLVVRLRESLRSFPHQRRESDAVHHRAGQ